MSARYWWCRICGHRVQFLTERNVWQHIEPGADHGPIPTTQRPEVIA
jgi:hypothetical protein